MKMKEKKFKHMISLLYLFFYDYDKIDKWLRKTNVLLGGLTPLEMINMGRGDRLYKLVKQSIEAN